MSAMLEEIWKSILPRRAVFTTREIAEAAKVRLSNASRELAKLADRGILTRVRRGVWAVVEHPDFSPFAVVPFLFRGDESGYVSLLSALHLHGMIAQIPRRVQVITTKQRADLETPVATYEFHQIQPELFGGHEPRDLRRSFEIATPEKALFDILYLSARRGRRFAALPELEIPEGLSADYVRAWIERIEHEPLRVAVERRWSDLARRYDLTTAA